LSGGEAIFQRSQAVNFDCVPHKKLLEVTASLKGWASMTDTIIPPAPEDRNNVSSVVYPDLTALREAKGLSLQDIFTSTRISVTNLKAIENGQYQLLPAPAYTRTFIRTTPRSLGRKVKSCSLPMKNTFNP
jgi:hypothetical protein